MVNNLTLISFLEKIEIIAKEGASIIIKLDGERSEDKLYTVVLSGGKLGESFFRKDGSELISLLEELIKYYNDIVSN